MLNKLEQIKEVFGIDITEKSKLFKDRYIRLCFYREMMEQRQSINNVRKVLKVNYTDIRRYPSQINKVIGTELFSQTQIAYKTLDKHLLTNIFSKNSLLNANMPIGTFPSKSEIPYSIIEVINIMKPHRDFENPLWDKELIAYTCEDWEEIETLKVSQQRINNSKN